MDKQLMRKRINEVIKTDATVVELQDFMATHLPFKKLKYYNSGIEAVKGKELNEENFFYEFIENTKDKHNFIVVQGDNGSGKSHFIRWIKNKIESEEAFPDDIVILLERSQNTLQATIKQLVNNETIQRFLSEEEKIKLKNTGIELSEEKFTSMINYNFIIEAENEEEDEDCILKSSQRRGLIELLKDEIIQKKLLFNNEGSIKRISNKLISSNDNSINEIDIRFTEKDFKLNSDILEELKESDANKKALRFAENLKEDKKGIRSKVAEYLNSKIDTVIQRTIKLNAADLNSILEKIRIKLKEINKNLILFIEDITAFTGVDKGVIESLIVEHRENNGLCRLFSVIGVTTGYYQSHFPDNLKDRVTGRVFIDSNSLFDENNDVLELAARYINAINIEKNQLKKWVSLGAINSELPIKESSKDWDIYKDNFNREFSLYPLTERSILNLYNAIQDKKTPRRFIKNILLPVLLHYTNDKSFPEGLAEFEAELTIPKFKNELLNRRIDAEINDSYENSRTKCLLRIWGNGTIDCYNDGNVRYIGCIDERIFNEFNVKKVEGNQVLSKIEYIKNKSAFKIQEKENYSIKGNIPLITEITTQKVKEEVKINKEQIVSKKLKEMDSMEKDLNDWFFNNENLKMHPKIREYVLSFLKEGISWDIEGVSMYLVNETLNLYNLKIRNQQLGDERGENILWIEKTEEDYYFLLSLMKYIIIGSKTWNYENAQDDILIVVKWLENNKKRIIEYVLNGNDTYYDMYEYAMCAEIYSTAINKNFKKDDSEIKINEMNVKCLFYSIIKKLEVKEEKKLIPILGRFAKTYFDTRSLINANHEFIINYYNCPLGKGKGVFLDVYEILKIIDKISKINFNINKFSDKIFKNDKEFWKRPYELLKKVYGLNLKSALSENLSLIQNKDKDYLESFDEIGSINTFFETLELNNIIYDGEVKDDFDRLFDDTIKYNKYVENKKCIKESNNINLLDKIYLLKSSTPKEIIKYNEVLEKIENIIIKQEEKYNSNISPNITTSEDINRVFNECILKIKKMEKNTNEVKEALKC